MDCKLVLLTHDHLAKLLGDHGPIAQSMEQSYFSNGSVSYCMLVDGEPVFAGGIVNMLWQRGEAWILPTSFWYSHRKTCFKHMREIFPRMASTGNFKRVQATCAVTISALLFSHLGFSYEGTMQCFGPNGEDCYMYARVFE